ncbi:BAG family molecular chaperone regulator 5 mitochondrial [Bienertia sinuspersici]
MKPNRKKSSSASSSSSSTITYTFQINANSNLPQSAEIPIKSSDPPIPITVHFHDHSAAASKIQAAYRASVIRTLVKKITTIEAEVDKLEKLIQQQETVDAVRSNEKEKLKINEALMVQLLKLDSIPGFDLGVKQLRRSMSRRIVGLQEVMDGICGERVMNGWDGMWRDWDDGFVGLKKKFVGKEVGKSWRNFVLIIWGLDVLRGFYASFERYKIIQITITITATTTMMKDVH